MLEDRRKELAASPELARQTDRLLGLCYERLGNPDQQLAAFRRTAEEGPSWLPARLGLASALLAAGKPDEALAEYRRLDPPPPEARLQAIRLLILRNLRSPADKRNWKEAEDLLNGAPEDVRKTADFRLAQVNLLVAQGRFDEAWKRLDAAVAEEPKEVRCRLALAELADLETKAGRTPPATAREVLDKAEGDVGDSVDLRLARAARFAGLDRAEAVKALGLLEEKADPFERFRSDPPAPGTGRRLQPRGGRRRRPPSVQARAGSVAGRPGSAAAAVRPVPPNQGRGGAARAGG